MPFSTVPSRRYLKLNWLRQDYKILQWSKFVKYCQQDNFTPFYINIIRLFIQTVNTTTVMENFNLVSTEYFILVNMYISIIKGYSLAQI